MIDKILNLENWTVDRSLTFVILLLITDITFISLHILFQSGLENKYYLFSIESDRGYPEIFQYIKELWIVLLLTFLAIRQRLIGYFIWSLLFVYLLCDDVLQIHEQWGAFLASNLGFSPYAGLRAVDFGELIVSGAVAAVFLVLLSYFYVRGAGAFRRTTKVLLLLLVALAFFGVFVDMVHVIFMQNASVFALLGLIEDGGEMIVISLIAGYAFLINSHAARVSDRLSAV